MKTKVWICLVLCAALYTGNKRAAAQVSPDSVNVIPGTLQEASNPDQAVNDLQFLMQARQVLWQNRHSPLSPGEANFSSTCGSPLVQDHASTLYPGIPFNKAQLVLFPAGRPCVPDFMVRQQADPDALLLRYKEIYRSYDAARMHQKWNDFSDGGFGYLLYEIFSKGYSNHPVGIPDIR